MRKAMTIAAVLAVLYGQAEAHAFLQAAVPPVGGKASAVSELRLTFTEALEPAFSTVTIRHADGAPVSGAKTQVDPQNPKVLTVTLLQPLPPGKYKVQWRVVSVDTHHTQGDYAFTVSP
ncbi:MAG: copper homeostasis periplasmic binding protein CopC [Alphaproteobacteria bacterium]|nr:copper homeostasis periplasmic binding protein CopC [Alphaproteobacteria bacterium]